MNVKTVWDKVYTNYTQVILLLGITAFLPFAYFVASGVTPLIFLIGALLLWHLRSAKAFWPAMLFTAALLVLGFLRSDFIDMLSQGKTIGQAAQASKMYFRAPMIMWAAIWSVVLAGYNLSGPQARRVFKWLSLLMLVLTGALAAEAVSHFGLRDMINRTWFHGARPEMVVVRVSDSNFALLFLFWPLTFWFMARGWMAAVIAMAITIVALGFVVDTNAQILALAASFLVFLAAKYWPRGWWNRGITPERTLAAAAGAFIFAFPFLMLWLTRSGLAAKIKPHLGQSWGARIDIWSFAVSKAAQKPWLGWGFESARNFEPVIPNHPHNMAIQAWLELGVPGLLLLAGLWTAIFWCMAPKGAPSAMPEAQGLRELGAAEAAAPVAEGSVEQQARPYWLALATCYFIINAISFGIWRDWLYSLGAFAAAMAIIAVKAVREGQRTHF